MHVRRRARASICAHGYMLSERERRGGEGLSSTHLQIEHAYSHARTHTLLAQCSRSGQPDSQALHGAPAASAALHSCAQLPPSLMRRYDMCRRQRGASSTTVHLYRRLQAPGRPRVTQHATCRMRHIAPNTPAAGGLVCLPAREAAKQSVVRRMVYATMGGYVGQTGFH